MTFEMTGSEENEDRNDIETLPDALLLLPRTRMTQFYFVRSRAINATKNRKVSESPWRLRGVPFPYRLRSNSPRFAPAT